jgi:hypothetical protein
MRLIALLFLYVPLSLAQPRFDADRVLPPNSDRQIPLEPAMLMSIYGNGLGPAQSCIGYGDQHLRETPSPLFPDPVLVNTVIYPKELCGVRVFVGQYTAGLLYVSAGQINFKVPQETGIEGTSDLRVVYQGQSSLPAVLKLGLQTTRVYLEQPASIDMPVWLRVEHPIGRPRTINYPFALGPAGFGCNFVEVRHNGIPLAQRPDADWMRHGGVVSGPPCGSFSFSTSPRHIDRLPLHLLYRFDAPGVYQLRYSLREWPNPQSTKAEITHSEWTEIEILPATPGQRASLLAETQKNLSTDPAEILSNLLPSILGFPDSESLDIVSSYLYHPSPSVRRYARTALSYWPARR